MPTLEELVESGDIERLNDRLNEMNTVEIAEKLLLPWHASRRESSATTTF